MSRPESKHVKTLRAFRNRLVEARRTTAGDDNLDTAVRRFIEIESAIGLVDKAIENELDMTPIPGVDDPTHPPRFPDSDKGPPLVETI
jgi:hypothetical protein